MNTKRGYEWSQSREKRSFDIAGSAALTAVFGPVATAAAAGIRAVDNMNPMFVQQRYGAVDETLTVHKLRTMPESANADTPSSGSHDIRATRVGSLLRKAHIDEVPQLIDIYRGDMSIVGVRPIVKADVEATLDALDATEREQWIAARAHTKAGVFGQYQLQRHKDNYAITSPEAQYRERAMHDIEFAHHTSFSYDLDILRQSMQAAWQDVVPTPTERDDLGYEGGIDMFTRAARSFGVEISPQQERYWRAIFIAARKIDDIVDVDKLQDVSSEVSCLFEGNVSTVFTDQESRYFREAMTSQSYTRRNFVRDSLVDLPQYAARKRAAITLPALLDVSKQEATMFADMLKLEGAQEGSSAEKFNRWVEGFAQAGYAVDTAVDLRSDYNDGLHGVAVIYDVRLTSMANASKEVFDASRVTSLRTIPVIAREALRVLRYTA